MFGKFIAAESSFFILMSNLNTFSLDVNVGLFLNIKLKLKLLGFCG